jgi:hypothetical protein
VQKRPDSGRVQEPPGSLETNVPPHNREEEAARARERAARRLAV